MKFKFGKRPAKHDIRTLKLEDYFTPLLPEPPPSYNVLLTVYDKLKISDPGKLFPLNGNDEYSNCTIAALAHAVTVYRGMIGEKRIWSQKNVLKLYLQLTKGKDNGLFELDVLKYWRKHIADGDRIIAFTEIDYKNHQHVKQAIRLFGGVYLGFQVPKNCYEDFEAGKTWQPKPLTNDGHAVYAVGYDNFGVTVLTWGNEQKGTWEWWDKCVDEAYAILPPEAKNKSFLPGFDFKQLKADLAEIGN